ncbi:MAG: hypothetical protein CL908_20135 [Deltaproteobacteria bacterium]|nr:hypothetical protein [Deltaproteobacteria bacterium]
MAGSGLTSAIPWPGSGPYSVRMTKGYGQISSDLTAQDHAELAAEIGRLRRRAALLGAIVGLVIALLRTSKIQL